MSSPVFDLPPPLSLPLVGEDASYPVGRIFCVGRNFAAHAAEMGAEVDREAPFYFCKSARHAAASGQTLPYPPGTADYHHEMELVVALGAPLFRATADVARAAVFGLGCGLDMTRRDLQAAAKAKRRPWDTGKDIENGAILGPLTRIGPDADLTSGAMTLAVNGDCRQSGDLRDMVHPVVDVLMDLSRLYHLMPGDLIMMGTPEGVGPVQPGDTLVGRIDGLADVSLTLAAAE